MPKTVETPTVLFSRENQELDGTSDDWDDSELLKMYDQAVNPLKAAVAKRMALRDALLQEASSDSNAEASAVESFASSKSMSVKEALPSRKRGSKGKHKKNKQKQHREWAVGDYCQAKYTADNQWYEATILSIHKERGTCVIQYVGYLNTEEQPLAALSHSMGTAVRREQAHEAKDIDSEANLSDDVIDRLSQASTHLKSHSWNKRNRQTDKVDGLSFNHSVHENKASEHPSYNSGKSSVPSFPGVPGISSNSFQHDMIPPPLPPHILSGLPDDDSEALSAMLMSWYMSGFHTGYYQGLKRGRRGNPTHL